MSGEIKKLVCAKCDTHLAILQADQVSVRFVVRDKRFQVYTIGGATIIRCRECGENNLHAAEAWEAANADETARLAGMARAKVEAWIPQDEFDKAKQSTMKEQ